MVTVKHLFKQKHLLVEGHLTKYLGEQTSSENIIL